VSHDFNESAKRAQQERREADLVANRARELYEKPIAGKFDAQHLQAVHAYLFQDTPRHQPGVIRDETGGWIKLRALEDKPGVYEVAYLADGVEGRIKSVLDDFGGPAALRGLSADESARKLARLYGDLDHAHGFYEGNSRTLREFTRTLAAEAGFKLDWTGTNVSPDQRNALYAARDLEVLTRQYPGMTPDTANTPAEYEATLQAASFRKTLGEHPLEKIIQDSLATGAHYPEPAPAKTADEYWDRVASKGTASASHTPDQAKASINQPYKGPVLE
jgi:fido (protein-threonine AMPylation protein)